MYVFETIKRRMVRAQKRLDRFVGYNNHEQPSLEVELGSGYTVRLSYIDLAHLVRAADRHAEKVSVDGLKEWREFGKYD